MPEAATDIAPEPSEFERLATDANGGRAVRRLGTVASREGGLAALETPARVPPHYVVQVGDEVSVTLWGSVDAQWLLRVDRAGRLTLPRVGPTPVSGAKASELESMLRARLERVFKNFELAVAVTDLSPVRVHITGFVERPGDYVVPGLTTISGAIAQAQGPAGGGSFRRIRLLRDDAVVTTFDLYSLLSEGRRRDDAMLQPGDVLYVEAAGPQVAVLGSVNRVAVFEFLPGETVADVLRLAGGYSSVAERKAVTLERLRERTGVGAVQLAMPDDGSQRLSDGDILRVKSQLAASGGPSQLRNKRVVVEGEVRSPGEYLLPANATLADALAAAGGATPNAFLFGTSLRRESVRTTQEANYDKALRELETDFARNASQRPGQDTNGNPVDAEAQSRQLLARLRARRPEGRVVLDLTPQATALPALELEDGDRIQLPPGNQSVGVFGSVFNAGSFLLDSGRRLGDYIQRAGGPTSGADYDAAFVVRANGSVLSARQGGWLRGAKQLESEAALPGDTIFVPEEVARATFVQGAKDWTQILYQLGVGLAALRTLR
jgi:protein involved in polysaccharide export with SLBB domain